MQRRRLALWAAVGGLGACAAGRLSGLDAQWQVWACLAFLGGACSACLGAALEAARRGDSDGG